MPLEIPKDWDRRFINGNIYWVRSTDIRCFSCGKLERVTISIFEGKYYPELEVEKLTEDGIKHIYPIFAPEGTANWNVPPGWRQIMHVASNFYPNEIITTIHINLEKLWRNTLENSIKYDWSDFVDSGGVQMIAEHLPVGFIDFIKHPIKSVRSMLKPEKITLNLNRERFTTDRT